MRTEAKQKMTADIALQNIRQITDQARLTKQEHDIIEESWRLVCEVCNYSEKGGEQ